jgi:hypothetical protein
VAGLPTRTRGGPSAVSFGPASAIDFINIAGVASHQHLFDGPWLEVTVPVGVLGFLLDTLSVGKTDDTCRTH